MNYKELAEKLRTQKFVPGHRSCSGCGFPSIVRAILASTDKPVVASCATGCLEVTSSIYPFTSWNVSFIHSAFENSAATITGAETAYRALKKKGKIVITDPPILTLARRFQAGGILRTYLKMASMHILYQLGCSPGILARWYSQKSGKS